MWGIQREPGHNEFVATRIEDVAVVLRSYPLGEADRILTLLTQDHGLIRAVAKGVRKPSSRFGSRLQPLNLVQVMLYQGRNLANVSAVDSVHLYGSELASDYVRWSAGHVLVEATERLVTEEQEPSRPHYRLLISGLAALRDQTRDPRLVIDAFLLRSLATGGWAPSFGDCTQCGDTGPHPWIHLPSGGAVCQDCKPSGAVSISPATSALLGALLSADWAVADAAGPTARRAASGVVAAYLQLHLERDLRSLPIADKAWLSELSVKLTSQEDVVA